LDKQPARRKKPVFPQFSPEDIKPFIITFAGTVAANIATVLLVGLAIVTARLFIQNQVDLVFIGSSIVMSIFAGVFLTWGLTAIMRHRSSKHASSYQPRDRIPSVFNAVLMGLLLICILIFLLSWVGIAVGIK
jgi:Na+/melibiose symporter-like transporter